MNKFFSHESTPKHGKHGFENHFWTSGHAVISRFGPGVGRTKWTKELGLIAGAQTNSN